MWFKRRKWFDSIMMSLVETNRISPLGDPLPGFPDEVTQRNTTGLAGRDTLKQAFSFYDDIVAGMKKGGVRSLDANSRVLDFGVGWGRVARLFLERVRAANIYGIDVDPEFVSLTQNLFPGGNFNVCAPFPPSSFADRTFDLISAYSVFSHLSENSTRAWFEEFSRILKPSGCLAFTTRDATFFNYLNWAKEQGDAVSGYTAALGRLFPDLADARSRYEAGEFVHATSQGVSGGGVRNETFYGESFIPSDYIRKTFGDTFDVVAESFDGERYDQRFFLLRKRQH
ncbi:class I SAM-dependent methyltransferase [Luteibacter sp. Lutesp34]|uniref:class I SAM-dependent methyltransferase n=1 Tax=Luteibacter sp. Lutesp34 TaxID=3243030 RepID=UPI0039B5900C